MITAIRVEGIDNIIKWHEVLVYVIYRRLVKWFGGAKTVFVSVCNTGEVRASQVNLCDTIYLWSDVVLAFPC